VYDSFLRGSILDNFGTFWSLLQNASDHTDPKPNFGSNCQHSRHDNISLSEQEKNAKSVARDIANYPIFNVDKSRVKIQPFMRQCVEFNCIRVE
jgi:hypothetical protein